MICTSCQTPAQPTQKFCRSCGSMLQMVEPAPVSATPAGIACPSCQHHNAPGRKFCRACGAALSASAEVARPSRVIRLPTDDEQTIAARDVTEELGSEELGSDERPMAPPAGSPPPGAKNQSFSQTPAEPVAVVGPPCEMCGAPAGGRRFCVDCDPPADTREPAMPLQPVPPPVMPADGSVEPRRRRMRVALIAAVLALVLAGAATVVAKLATQDDSKLGRPATATRPPATAAAAPEDSTPGSVPTPGEPHSPVQPDRATADDEARTNQGAVAATADTGPENALREHWEAIGAGDFSAAYDRFSSKYRAGRGFDDWSTGMRGFSPDVAIVEIEEIEADDLRATVRLILATRDRGDKGDPSRCHIFRGRVRVVRERGRWLYDPPGLHEKRHGGIDPPGLHEKRHGGIDPSGDERCDPLFP